MKRKYLYEKLYFHEIEQKDKLVSRLQLLLAVILTLFGFLGYLFQSATPVFETGVYRYVFWVAWFLAVLFYLIGGFFFVRALWGNAYTFLASPNENEKYYQELRLQHKDERKAKKNARKKFRRHMG